MTSDNKTFLIHLATSLSDHSTLSVGEAEQFVGKFFDVVRASLLTDKIVKVRGLGTFKLVDVEPRESVKVVTGERYVIAGHSKVTFTPDPVLRDAVNRPFADFQTVELNDGVDLAIMEAVDEPESSVDEPEPINENETSVASDTAADVDHGIAVADAEILMANGDTDDVSSTGNVEGASADESRDGDDEGLPVDDEPEDDIDNELESDDDNELESDVVEAEPDDEPDTDDELYAPDEPDVDISDDDADKSQDYETEHDDDAENESPAILPLAEPNDADDADSQTNVGHANVVQHAKIVESAEYVRDSDNRHRRDSRWLYLLFALIGLAAGYVIGFYIHPLTLSDILSHEPARVSLERENEQRVGRKVQQTHDNSEATARPAETSATAATSTADAPATQRASDAKQTSSDAKQTSSDAKQTSSDAKQTSSDAKTIAAGAKSAETAAAAAAAAAAMYPQLEGGEYEIIGVEGTEVMRPGKTLLNISLKYYKSKNFVNYICLMNGISNPDIVPVDKELQIPKLRKK
jgi:nucleoid DNA-binding protein